MWLTDTISGTANSESVMGQLTLDDTITLIDKFGLDYTHEEIEDIFNEADTGNDGTLNFLDQDNLWGLLYENTEDKTDTGKGSTVGSGNGERGWIEDEWWFEDMFWSGGWSYSEPEADHFIWASDWDDNWTGADAVWQWSDHYLDYYMYWNDYYAAWHQGDYSGSEEGDYEYDDGWSDDE